jgi:hypothetical protein
MSEKSHLEMTQDLIAKNDQKFYDRPHSPARKVNPEPPIDPKARRATWAPDKIIISLKQHLMYGAWKFQGAFGLAEFICSKAKAA